VQKSEVCFAQLTFSQYLTLTDTFSTTVFDKSLLFHHLQCSGATSKHNCLTFLSIGAEYLTFQLSSCVFSL